MRADARVSVCMCLAQVENDFKGRYHIKKKRRNVDADHARVLSKLVFEEAKLVFWHKWKTISKDGGLVHLLERLRNRVPINNTHSLSSLSLVHLRNRVPINNTHTHTLSLSLTHTLSHTSAFTRQHQVLQVLTSTFATQSASTFFTQHQKCEHICYTTSKCDREQFLPLYCIQVTFSKGQ
jgi:hypothetical protein